MKKGLCILLLSIFSIQAFYTAGVVTWFHLNKNYVVSVLCENRDAPEKKCNGNCVLRKKAKQESKDETTTRTVQLVEIAPCIITEVNFTFTVTSTETNHKSFLENNYHFTPEYSIFRPPLG